MAPDQDNDNKQSTDQAAISEWKKPTNRKRSAKGARCTHAPGWGKPSRPLAS